MRFFDLDSKSGRFLAAMADLMLLNICFIIGCLPIFSIGASLTASYTVFLGPAQEGGVVKRFCQGWKENLRMATAFWLAQAAVSAILMGCLYLAVQHYEKAALLWGGVIWVSVVLGIGVTGISVTVYPQIGRYRNSWGNYLKNAFILACLKPGWLMVVLLLFMLPVLMLLFFPGLFLCTGFVWPLFGFSLILGCVSKCMDRILEPLAQSVPQ